MKVERIKHRIGFRHSDLASEQVFQIRDQKSSLDLNQLRKTTEEERTQLIAQGNIVEDWDTFLIHPETNISLIRNNLFYGFNRIGRLEPGALSHHDLTLPEGIYFSTVVSSDIGDHCAIHRMGYLAYFIVHAQCILSDIGACQTTSEPKFGNGVLHEHDQESSRIWLELINENGGRKVLPFESMLVADAFLWSHSRGDEQLMNTLKTITHREFLPIPGTYGEIGSQCVIKNCRILKDIKIGSHAYIKGANKLKNMTILSDRDSPSQIGEGVEMVNGIMGYGSRSFYGVKAVRFVMGENTTLKYGARLINSYLGDNSTISCCEVLNSLIYPFHEQHHNNSFLCASMVEGQSNIASGATIGSNHNSRRADGELLARRGFWPALSVSLKHNSRFASYTLIAKADYPYELDNPFPFALINHNVKEDCIEIMPAYWWMYNKYSLFRNQYKYASRDQRTKNKSRIDTEFLQADTVQEILNALTLLYQIDRSKSLINRDLYKIENSRRIPRVLKIESAVRAYQEMVYFFCVDKIIQTKFNITFIKAVPYEWTNAGGTLVTTRAWNDMTTAIKSQNLASWQEIHRAYETLQLEFPTQLIAFIKHIGKTCDFIPDFDDPDINWNTVLKEYNQLLDLIESGIRSSREKDYTNSFRQMMYASREEMDKVIGKLDDDSVIRQTSNMISKRRIAAQEWLTRQTSHI